MPRMISLFAVLLLFSQACVSLTANEVYKIVSQSVYVVYGYDSEKKIRVATGTGVAVSENILVTNCHLALGADSFQIKFASKLKQAKIIFKDPTQDLCFLEVANKTFKPVLTRSSTEVKIGEDVYAIGNPHGLEKTISRGIISNKHKFIGGWLLQTDATISFGSSGGGLFDTKGKLLGITRAGHRYKNIAFAVPSDWITKVLQVAQSSKNAEEINATMMKAFEENYTAPEIQIDILGRYGTDSISVVRYKQQCFIGFLGTKNKQTSSLLVWYPLSPYQVFFLPYESDIQKSVQQLVKYGFIDLTTGDIDEQPGNQSQLPVVMQTTGVVVKSFDVSPEEQFVKAERIVLHYPDMQKNYTTMVVVFGLRGFTKAFSEFKKRCVDQQ